MVDVLDLLILSRVPEIGPGRLYRLVTQFGGPRAVLEAGPRELALRGGLPPRLASAVARFRRGPAYPAARQFAERQLADAARRPCAVVTCWDAGYPELLRHIHDPPPLLYVWGNLPADGGAVAVVGTRRPTVYGMATARRFAGELARCGITVASGLARGIDTAAHAAALDAGGRTISVIGSGLDVIYPPENLPLARRIASSGAVVSECPMGAQPEARNFPRRNRIISGMTYGTLVVESGPAGGAMITARSALEQNREVFAVPAPLVPGRSHGTNALIREGCAKLVETVDDLLDELPEALRRRMPRPELTRAERAVVEALRGTPEPPHRISARAHLTPAETLECLERLVLRRLARKFPGNAFARRA